MDDLISIRDLKKEDVELILNTADEMEVALRSGKINTEMKGRILANLFFEPSTRTRFSFETAMLKLGGSVIGFDDPKITSLEKGETLSDTIKTVEKYCDLIVIRHPKEGAPRLAASVSSKPVINAGDGSNQHPTQALLDLYAIKKLKGKIGNLNIALLGDLRHARVMKSLIYCLAMFDANLILISPMGLEIEKEIVQEVKEKFNNEIFQTNDIYAGLRTADVLYVCRLQKERFSDPYEAKKLENAYKITPDLLKQAKDDLIILHSLPRLGELDRRIDNTKHAKYFDQIQFGVPVRMAIIHQMMR